MRTPVTWSPKARLELADIWNYVKQDSGANALQILHDIAAAVDRLEEYPFSGRMVPEWKQPILRELIVGNYRVMHSIEPEEIIVFTVRHSRRRLPRRFRREWLR